MVSMTLTIESEAPPTARLDMDTGVPGAVFTSLVVQDSAFQPIREQPHLGTSSVSVHDYEFGSGTNSAGGDGPSAYYRAIGTYEVPQAADWTETWSSLASWSGATASWSVGGSAAASTVVGAAIVRGASGTIRRLSVTTPSFVRVELLDSTGVVVAAISTTTMTSLVAAGVPDSSNQTGTYEVVLANGNISVNGTGWTLSSTYTGTPTQVRLVSLGTAYSKSLDFGAIGSPRGMAYLGSNVALIVDHANKQIRKFNTSTGVEITGGGFPFSTTGDPRGVAVDGSGNIYVTDGDNLLVRKFNSSGVAGTTWGTTSYPYGIAFNLTTGNLHVSRDNSGTGEIRRYSTTGSTIGSAWTVGGTPRDVAVDSAGISYVTDATADIVRVIDASGAITASYPIGTDIRGICVDNAGNFFVSCPDEYSIRKYTTAGVALTSISLASRPYGVAMAGSNVLASQYTPSSLVTRYNASNAGVGTVTETPGGDPLAFDQSVSTHVPYRNAWLIHPIHQELTLMIDPGLDGFADPGINVDISSMSSVTSQAASTTFTPIGRTRQVVITNGDRFDGAWTLVLLLVPSEDDPIDDGLRRWRTPIQDILADQSPLLLRSPYGITWDLPDGWYSVGDVTYDRIVGGLQHPYRRVTLPLTPVDNPPPRYQAPRSYGDLLTEADTYSDLSALHPTYLDVLTG